MWGGDRRGEPLKIENQRPKILYLDPFSGIAGDMLLGALLDLGLDLARLQAELGKFRLGGYHLKQERVMRAGISAVKFSVELEHHEEHGHQHAARRRKARAGCAGPHHHEHRTWADIKALIEASVLAGSVKSKSISVFEKLAAAEGKIHGQPLETVQFHEVGAVDSIVDIVGACIGLELLGVSEVRCGPVALGSGTVKCAHGILPVPAPATAELMKGLPVRASPVTEELTTPTGAALIATLATRFGPLPDMTIEKIGYGAGTREQQAVPNVLRAFLGTTAGAASAAAATADTVLEIRTNVDDVSAEVLGHVSEKLLAQGALDVFFVPIQMKKSRPGTLLTVLAEPEQLDAVAAVLFRECGTFGLRYQAQSRLKLARRVETVTTEFGPVRVKIGEWQGQVVSVHPEFEDCRARAEEKGVPVRIVIEAARRAYAASCQSAPHEPRARS